LSERARSKNQCHATGCNHSLRHTL
jgi:hypothetical protein